MNEREREILERVLDAIEGILVGSEQDVAYHKKELPQLTARLNEARRAKR